MFVWWGVEGVNGVNGFIGNGVLVEEGHLSKYEVGV